MELEPKYIGWTSKVQKKKCTFFISLSKLVVLGACINIGKPLFCYLYQDKNKRPVGLIYLDGKPKDKLNLDYRENNTFIIREGSKNSHPTIK
ncbi:hypothetical protein ACFL6G_04080 [candidate division KSB1 bacterium]